MRTILNWLGIYTINIDAIAGAITVSLLEDYAPGELAHAGTVQFLRTRYMELVARYGLPTRACDKVAERGWKLIQRAGGVSHEGTGENFAFYE